MESGATFLITLVAFDRRPIFMWNPNPETLVEILFRLRDQGKYRLHEFAILPDHLHVLITPEADVSVEQVVQCIRDDFSQHVGKRVGTKVWQKKFTKRKIRDAAEYEKERLFIRQSPIRGGWASDSGEYACCSTNTEFHTDAPPQAVAARAMKAFA